MPATVQAILAARIDRLPPEDKRLLQAAAVIGKDVPFALLQAIAEEPEDELRRGLARLQAAEFLYETRLFPDLEYTFKHALTHEVAYGSLLQERRRALHARIVEAIETLLRATGSAEHVERLAHHAVRGEVWEQGRRPTSARPGAKALGALGQPRGRRRASSRRWRRCSTCPRRRETLEQAIDLRLDLRNALFPLGEFERVLGYLREAEALAEDARRHGGSGWVVRLHVPLPLDDGHPTEALAFGRACPDHRRGARGSVALRVAANLYFGGAYLATGDYRRAEDSFTSPASCSRAIEPRALRAAPDFPS